MLSQRHEKEVGCHFYQCFHNVVPVPPGVAARLRFLRLRRPGAIRLRRHRGADGAEGWEAGGEGLAEFYLA